MSRCQHVDDDIQCRMDATRRVLVRAGRSPAARRAAAQRRAVKNVDLCRQSEALDGCPLRMNEMARLGSEAIDAHETASSPVPFEGFFEQERDQLYRALWLVTRNRFEAEELTQEAFVRVLERWDRVSEMEDPHAYLFQTAMNAFRTGYGRAVLAARRTIKVLPPDDAITEIDERDATVRALAGLSPRQRAAVVLTDMLGFGSEQAAGMLGIRPSTLRMHASRARAVLKETMSRD